MSARDEKAAAAAGWWRSLGPVPTNDGRTLPGDRAALARLRRCSSALEAAVEPATAKLFRALALDRRSDEHLVRAAVLAAVLAHVREETHGERNRIARAIGAPPGGNANEALLKPVRFRALMAARTPDEMLTSFRRVVAILDRKANVRNLAEVLLGWTDDEAGDRVRTRFAFDYHGAADYAPRTAPDAPATISEKA